ncbi:MAG: STT3 domain-containing protein [Candidatus Omnitrophota bacterium]
MKNIFSSSAKKIIIYVLIFLSSAAIGVYFRLYPFLNYTSSAASEKASLLVVTRLKSATQHDIQKKFPQMPPSQQNQIAEEEFNKLVRKNKANVRLSIDKMAKEIDLTETDRDNGPYLLEADPYYYFSLTRNIVRTGKIADTIKGSKYLNKLMLAPTEHWEPFTLHPFVGFGFYKILSFFNRNIELMQAVGFVPIVLFILCLIPYSMIWNLLGCGRISSFLGTIFLSLSPMFLQRSAWGWYDNDPYNVFFAPLILAFLFLGIDRLRKNQVKSAFGIAVACSSLITLYAFFWQGWVYILSIIFLASIAMLIYNHFGKKEKLRTKDLFFYLAIVQLTSLVGIGVTFGAKEFFILFLEGWNALKNFLTPQLRLWPDLFISVGELKKTSLNNIISLDGGIAVFSFAVLGLVGYGIRAFRASKKEDPLKFIAIAFLFFFSLFIALRAERFALLSLIALSILFPYGLQYAFERSRNILAAKLAFLPFKVTFYAFISLGLCTMLFFSIRTAHNFSLEQRPIFNAIWDKALTKIRSDTPEESIVNSWWPPGHFITSMAQRRVTFDGATINNPQAYWLANVFLSQNERQALGILRMINNSANQASEYLQSLGIKLSVAVAKIHQVTSLNARDAAIALGDILTEEQVEHLLSLTHALPPSSYFFLYNDMVEKNLELGFVGRWNFKKMEEISADKKLLKQVPPRNSPQYIRFLWDTIGGPLNYSEIFVQRAVLNNVVHFPNGLRINLNDMNCALISEQSKIGIPQSIFYLENNDVIEKKFANANLSFSVLLFQEKNRYSCLFLDPRLGNSLLMRLYFFDGKGLRYITPFTKEQDLTGRTKISVFEVDWKKFTADTQF